MKFRNKQKDAVEVDTTPLIDMVFLLLIFFMVTATFDQKFEMGIELPKAASEQHSETASVEISIDAEGHYYVNQQRLVNDQMQTLQSAVKSLATGEKDTPIILSADARTPHQSVITAMDAVRQLGFSRLSFGTQQVSPGK